jgi:DNA polymerase III gamma/tau subunit
MRTKIEDKPGVAEKPLHIKYRPARLKDVVGQDAVVKALETMLKMGSIPHVFLFTGPPGTGKTTLARILATQFHCSMDGLIEIDAASNSGIDDMRQVTSTLRYNGFGEQPNKAIIIDECQGLSKQAWDSLLKSTEDTPAHVFFFFCSTNPAKIPAAMMTRCVSFNLRSVGFDDLMDVLEDVCKKEDFDTPEKILTRVAQAAEGSVRGALTLLAKVHAVDDVEEADVLLALPTDNTEVIDLCRQLVKGDLKWGNLVKTLKSLEDIPAETIRILVVNYLNACLMGAKSDRDVPRLLDMLQCFSKPCNPSDKMAPILLAFGVYIFP